MTRATRSTMTTFGTLALLLATIAGCDGQREGGTPGVDRHVMAVATTSMIADVVRQIGGEHVEVVGLMGPGVDPHLYKASEGDGRRLYEADIVFYNGLHLEAKMGEVLREMSAHTTTVAVAEAVPSAHLISPADAYGTHDPHIWFDVSLWMYAVTAIRDGLSMSDPLHAEIYAARAAAYTDSLAALDLEIRDLVAAIPPEQRILVTAHDAFGYFGRAYGFEVRGLQGISTVSEAGARDVQQLAAYVAAERIPAIFVESSVSPRAVRAVREAVKARGFEIRIGAELYSDALGSTGTSAGTYTGMVRHNVAAIVAGLRNETSGGGAP